MDVNTGLETKIIAGDGGMGEFLNAFEAFKDANDERLGQIEKRMAADVVTSDKVERINRALDDLTLKMKRPQLGGPEKDQPTEHKRAFEAYVRKGETHGLFDIEAKSMSVGSNPDGGYLVPAETEAEIGRLLSNASAMRAISDVRQVSASVYKKPFAIRARRVAGLARRRRGLKRRPPRWPSCSFPPWSSMPCLPRRRACWMTRWSISTSGSPRKCGRFSPSRSPRPL